MEKMAILTVYHISLTVKGLWLASSWTLLYLHPTIHKNIVSFTSLHILSISIAFTVLSNHQWCVLGHSVLNIFGKETKFVFVLLYTHPEILGYSGLIITAMICALYCYIATLFSYNCWKNKYYLFIYFYKQQIVKLDSSLLKKFSTLLQNGAEKDDSRWLQIRLDRKSGRPDNPVSSRIPD